jgi:SAM-dependent methyltransferase
MENVTDYLKLWRELVIMRNSSKTRGQRCDIWESRAEMFDHCIKKRWEKPDSSRRWITGLLRRHPGSTLLDIGAGTGAWTCLAAPYCSRVTALEPSQAMIDVMKKNIADTGADNIDIIQAAWPVDMPGTFDFTLSSHSIYGCADFEGYIRALQAATRKTCILLLRAPAPDSLMADISRTILGQPYDSPNFQIAYNALLQMGIFADVIMEDSGFWKPWTYSTLRDAVDDVKKKMGVMNTHLHDAMLSTLLGKHLRRTDDGLIWPENIRSVLVYWNVKNSGHHVRHVA